MNRHVEVSTLSIYNWEHGKARPLAFGYSLPSGAPVLTPYAASATALSFAANTGFPTGTYTLAGTAGATAKTIGIDVTTTDYAGTGWTIP